MEDPNAVLAGIAKQDPRYALEAYFFVFKALAFSVNTQKKGKEGTHVTGKELLLGIREMGRRDFGYLAKLVFNRWGVKDTSDFGNIVFNLVNNGLMGATSEDRLEDFEGGFDFTEAFENDLGIEFK